MRPKAVMLAAALGLLVAACGNSSGSEADAGSDATVETNPFSITFTDVSNSLGGSYHGGTTQQNVLGVGSGAAVADVDGDGDLDLFLARCDTSFIPGGPSLLLRNTGSGSGFVTFEKDVEFETAFADACAHGASFGDYDRDGHVDLYVVLDGEDRLYKNDGDGTFTDVTATAQVAGPAGDANTSAYWVDVNRDGLLDLFVPAHALPPPMADAINKNRLYINRGDGTFASVGAAAGIEGDGSSQACAITDLDGDRDLEIYVANDQFFIEGGRDRAQIQGGGGASGLDPDAWHDVESYDDQGIPTYIDRGVEYGMDVPRSSMGIAIADINGDGRDDVYIADNGTNDLYLRTPSEFYEERAAEYNIGLRDALLVGFLISWDVEFADIDRDGSLELIVINGSIGPPRECEDYTQFDSILRFDPSLNTFVEITAKVGWPFDANCLPMDDRPLSGRGLILADLDGDHDDDLVITPFAEKYRLYRNDTPLADRHFLRIEPRGTVSAPLPYGAILELTGTDDKSQRRNLYAGGTNTQRYPRMEIALGNDVLVEEATLHWPSGYSQRLDMTEGFKLDETWVVTEPNWLSLSTRVATDTDAPPVLTYQPVDAAGKPIGAAAAGRTVIVSRSDGVSAPVTDNNDGTYTAILSHPNTARITVVTVDDNGNDLEPRLTINYK